MTSILIRVDASLLIGSGHVIRCRTLGRELRLRGADVSFVCRRQPGDLIDLLQSEFSVFVLPELPLAYEASGGPDELQGRGLYAAWLGCSQEQDASDSLNILHHAGINSASWLVVDHYGLDASWESEVLAGLSTKARPSLLVIDDLADRQHQADCLLDQNFFGVHTVSRYDFLVPEHCRQLLGPQYALVGPEYAQLHPIAPVRTDLKRVLVFFGGVDSFNLTGRVLEALTTPALADLEVDVVVGHQSPYRNDAQALVASRPLTTLHDPLPSLAGLILRADLAIGAGGATTWERACLGLPSLVVTTAKNQLPFIKELHQAKLVRWLGEEDTLGVDLLRKTLLSIRQQSLPLVSGYALTDGWGASRTATACVGIDVPIHLRLAKDSDAFLHLRCEHNEEMCEIEQKFFLHRSSKVDQKNLQFDQNINTECLQLIVNDSSGCPLGQIRCVRDLSSDLDRPQLARMNILADSCAFSQDFTAELVRLGMENMEYYWGMNKQYSVDILTKNLHSNAIFAVLDVDNNIGLNIISKPASSQACSVHPSFITILSDSSSWLNSYLPILIKALWQRGHALRWIHHPVDLAPGDICFLLSCSFLLKPEQLGMHRHNLVVHASDLPQGQGWSPMTWQILDGSSEIPLTLFEAVEELDAGVIYLQETIKLQGTELVDQWRELQAQASIKLCLDWIDRYKKLNVRTQIGETSFYKRRRPQDSRLDLDRPLAEQFNLLRVVDNQAYPAYFETKGQRYEVNIKLDSSSNL